MKKKFVESKVIGDKSEGFGLLIIMPSGEEKEYRALFTERPKTEELCQIINRFEIPECHVYDVIEDYLP
jgi:hypothetical protein